MFRKSPISIGLYKAPTYTPITILNVLLQIVQQLPVETAVRSYVPNMNVDSPVESPEAGTWLSSKTFFIYLKNKKRKIRKPLLAHYSLSTQYTASLAYITYMYLITIVFIVLNSISIV